MFKKILEFFKSEPRQCECGKYPKCIREVNIRWSNWYGVGSMGVSTHDHIMCGKVQKQIKNNKL